MTAAFKKLYKYILIKKVMLLPSVVMLYTAVTENSHLTGLTMTPIRREQQLSMYKQS